MSTTPPPQRPSKIEVMRALLEHAEAQIHLDARREGVQLPARLRSSGNVILDYGYRFTPSIPDLSVDEDGVRATLSFSGVPFQTFVPWSAVFLITDFAGHGAVWREDLPAELVEQVEVDATPDAQRTTTERDLAPRARPFSIVSEDATTDGDEEPPPEPPRPRPALRLVK